MLNADGSCKKEVLWTKNLIVLLVINALIFFSFQFYSPALPPYLKSLGVPESMLGWFTALAMFSALLVRPLVGSMLDSYGRKGLFLSGLALVTIVCTIMYFSPYALIILVLRLFQGIGWGIISTSTATIAADNIPRSRFGEGVGYFSLSSSIALAVAPAIALSLHIDTLFILSASFMLTALVLALFLKYKSIEKVQKASFKFSLEKTAIIPTIVMYLTNISYGAVVTFMVIYAKSRGIENISAYYVVYACTLMVTRPNIGKLVDKNLYKAVIIGGLSCLVIALCLISISTSIYWFVLSAFFYGLGQGAVLTTAQTLSVLNAPEHRVGMASATFAIGFDTGIGTGAILSGLLVHSLGYSLMYFSLVLTPILAGIIFITKYKGHNTVYNA